MTFCLAAANLQLLLLHHVLLLPRVPNWLVKPLKRCLSSLCSHCLISLRIETVCKKGLFICGSFAKTGDTLVWRRNKGAHGFCHFQRWGGEGWSSQRPGGEEARRQCSPHFLRPDSPLGKPQEVLPHRSTLPPYPPDRPTGGPGERG